MFRGYPQLKFTGRTLEQKPTGVVRVVRRMDWYGTTPHTKSNTILLSPPRFLLKGTVLRVEASIVTSPRIYILISDLSDKVEYVVSALNIPLHHLICKVEDKFLDRIEANFDQHTVSIIKMVGTIDVHHHLIPPRFRDRRFRTVWLSLMEAANAKLQFGSQILKKPEVLCFLNGSRQVLWV